MRRPELPSPDRMIRTAVILTLLGLLLLLGVLVTINALVVGLFMLGSVLIAVGMALYVIVVVRELRERKAL